MKGESINKNRKELYADRVVNIPMQLVVPFSWVALFSAAVRASAIDCCSLSNLLCRSLASC